MSFRTVYITIEKYTIFANASMVDDQCHLINKPFVFNL